MIGRHFAGLLKSVAGSRRDAPVPDAAGFNQLGRCRYGVMLYNVNDRYIGRSLQAYGEYCQAEADLLARFVRPGDIVVDAGANIGTLTLFFARAVAGQGRVYAFEPQRVIFQTLCANIALNSLTNVHAFQAALADTAGATTTDAADYRLENNYGGMPLGLWPEGERVPMTTLDSLGLDRCDLAKIDVEGMEAQVLQGAEATLSKCRPALYVENDREDKAAELIDCVKALGYRPFWHCPPYFNPDNFLRRADNLFGNLASRNMLCLPEEGRWSVEGLPPAG